MKIDEKICFSKGDLGDLTDKISTQAKKKSRNKTKIHFWMFIGNQNSGLKVVFRFDNENENQKNFKIEFHFKSKSNIPFDPRIFLLPMTFIFHILFKSNLWFENIKQEFLLFLRSLKQTVYSIFCSTPPILNLKQKLKGKWRNNEKK